MFDDDDVVDDYDGKTHAHIHVRDTIDYGGLHEPGTDQRSR